MKIGILGAGVSGLSAGRLLAGKHEVEILERDHDIGGIAKVRMVDGVPYHTVGGHCLNSRNQAVMEFAYDALPRDQWHAVQRVAKISFKGHLIDYPIEFSVRQIAEFDEELAFRIVRDFLAARDGDAPNLDAWFRMKFGDTLAAEYLIPYNEKIWGRAPSEMSPVWVEGKLPTPSRMEMFRALLRPQKDSMPHATFTYPNGNTQNAFFAALAAGLHITRDYPVTGLERDGQGWIVNGEKRFDAIISTLPLKVIPSVVIGAPAEVLNAAALLRYNKVSNMLWETDEVEATWTYHPDASTIFHRHIHIGNFTVPRTNHTITEAVGERSPEEMEREGRKFDYLKRPIDHHISDYAYVVYDHCYAPNVALIKQYLADIGLHTLGRFGEWEYYNMDVCIGSAMNLSATFDRP
jgi:protoporphyrinogen oxidase